MKPITELEPGGQGATLSKPPRSKEDRKAHVLRVLLNEDKLWLATSGERAPHVVPLSYVWRDSRIVMAVPKGSPSARNLCESATARAVLGTPLDAILIDGMVEQIEPCDMKPATVEALCDVSAVDPLRTPGFTCLVLHPFRVQAYGTPSEVWKPTLMRQGRWLVPGEGQ